MSKAVLVGALVLLASGLRQVFAGDDVSATAAVNPGSRAQQEITELILATPPPPGPDPDPEPKTVQTETSIPLRRAIFSGQKAARANRAPRPPEGAGRFNPVDQAFYLAGQGGETLEHVMTDLLNSKSTKTYFESQYMIDLRFHGATGPTKRTSWGIEMKLPEQRVGFDFKVKF